jgi:hypothetical protein
MMNGIKFTAGTPLNRSQTLFLHGLDEKERVSVVLFYFIFSKAFSISL